MVSTGGRVKLDDSQQYWDRMAEVDPLWAILSEYHKLGGRWDVDDFFATGRTEIDDLLQKLAALSVPLEKRRALDFGCGVGRLSQALARQFDRVVGVDISTTMIEKAREFNRFPDTCSYVVNATDDLSQFEDATFSFLYSRLVLQHISPAYVAGYLREFCRVLAANGVLVFQIPNRRPRTLAQAAQYYSRNLIGKSPQLVRLYRKATFSKVPQSTLDAMPPSLMLMEGLDNRAVTALLRNEGVTVLHTELEPDQADGPLDSWLYIAIKTGSEGIT
jgi:ubiquinone/menaquinone biosynthesis C-methylase UbiE